MAVVSSVAVAAAPQAGAATTFTSKFLYTNSITVHTTTHHKLKISLTTDSFPSGIDSSSDTFFVTLNRGSVESHAWNGQLPSGSNTIDAATGKGRVKGTLPQHFGSLSLKATPTGSARTTTCGSSTTKTWPEKFVGSINFNTKSKGSHRWGRVRQTVRFKNTTFSATSDNGSGKTCTPPATPCPPANISYNASNPSGSINLFGSSFGKRHTISLSKSQTYGSPSDYMTTVYRSDYASGKTTTPTFSHTSKAGSLSVRTTKGGVSGRLSLHSTNKHSSRCKSKSVTLSYGAANLAAHHLKGHEQVFGNIVLKSTKNAGAFSITKRK